MKKKLIRLFIAVGLVLGVGSCADVTDTPEYYGVYKEANIYGAQNETYIEGWEKKTSNILIYKRLCKI